MNVVVIVQARVGSTRLRGKVLKILAGQSVLGHVTDRLRLCQQVDEIVIATTDQPEDQAIAAEADRLGVRCVRGSETDVLSRYHLAATESSADVIVRVTSDCPLIDPKVIDRLVRGFRTAMEAGNAFDYFSNTHPRTFPHGLDAEVFSKKALDIAFREATEKHEREHVTPFFYLHPDRFALGNLSQSIDQSGLRWTLDELADWLFLEAVFRHIPEGQFASTERVLSLVARFPELAAINSGVQQKSLRAA